MKRRRIMAMALAVAMLSSSVSFNVYAEDNASEVKIDASDVVVSSTAVSDSSSSNDFSDTVVYADADEVDFSEYLADGYVGGIKTNMDNTGEWKYNVSGSVSTLDKVSGFSTRTDANGNRIPFYTVEENNGKVNIGMGTFESNGVYTEGGSTSEAVGKIAASNDGFTYYYQELDPSENFILKGTVKVNKLWNKNNQVSFGAMVRDKLIPTVDAESYAKYCAYKKVAGQYADQAAELMEIIRDNTGKYTAEEKADAKSKRSGIQAKAAEYTKLADNIGLEYMDDLSSPYVAAGPLYMNNFGNSNNATVKAFYRNSDKALSSLDTAGAAYEPLFAYDMADVPKAGDVYKVVVKKQGDLYSLQFGDNTPVTVDKIQLTGDKIYAGFFAARAADITVSNVSLEKIKEVSSIEIASLPTKTEYIVSKTPANVDTEGLEIKVNYADGTSETVDASEAVVGNADLTTVGKKTVDVNYGGKSASFDINVDYNRVTNMTLTYKPFNLEYLAGSRFNTVGLEVDAEYKNGTAETLSPSQYEVSIDGKVVGSNYYFTASDVGTHTVAVAYKDTADILSDGHKVEYEITVNPASLKALEVRELPVKGTVDDPFDLNEEFDPAGLIIEGVYDNNGTESKKVLDEDEYTITGYDFSKEGETTLTVTFNNDPSLTTTFKVLVVAKKPTQAVVLSYPRQTYFVGENFDPTGLKVAVQFSNGDVINVEDTNYTMTVDTSNFDSSQANTADNTCSVSVIVDFGTDKSTVVIPIKIDESENRIWKSTLMGASSLGVSVTDPSSSITVYDKAGEEALYLTGDAGHKIEKQPVGLMKDGEMTNVSKVNVRSWAGSGKYATDHDGIAYYYTRVKADNNYVISADVTVNNYIRDPENSSDDRDLIAKKKTEMQAVFDKYGIKDENGERRVITDLEALDMVRSGQEAFGIMARDVVPLYLPFSEGGDETSITTDFNKAYKDEYGEPINIFEAYKMQEAGKIDAGLAKEDINNISFASNVVVAGGATSSTFPTNPTVSSFKEKEVQNRITLSFRTGVSATNGAGSNGKSGFKTTTSHLPVKGDKYNITLKRINYGYSLTTVDLTEGEHYGETQTVYSFDERENLGGLLTTQDQDNVYVGFFACRYADIDVENIHFNATNASVDELVPDLEEDIYSPKVSVESSLYTESTNYMLKLKASNPSGGLVTIKQNGKVIYEDVRVAKAATSYDVELVPSSKNEFEFIYTPSKADLCYDYSKVVSRATITCKSMAALDDVIYVAPKAPVDGAGTRENPTDFETAIGLVKAGQKIVMLDGTYTTTDTITIDKSASAFPSAKKYIVADEGATPIVDLQNKEAGFIISADYWEFDGITVMNSGGNSKPFHIGGNHNLVKNCTFHDNGDCGLQISRTDNSNAFEEWPSNNLILNCEAYNNCDPSKNNADGFAVKLTVGNNNMFKGCVSHHNLDDGWDLYTKLSTGAIGEVVLEDCASYRQGFQLLPGGVDTDYNATSGGNGFKAGGESIGVMHYFKDCKAFNNKGNGYDSNTNPVGKLRNVVFYNNLYSNVAMYSPARLAYGYDLEGVVSYRDEKGLIYEEDGSLNSNILADRVGSYTEYQQFKNNVVDLKTVDSNYLIWDDPTADSVNNKGEVVTASFFKSLNEGDSLNSEMRYNRGEDGAFIWGDYLARVTPYTHKSEDLVTLPDTGVEDNNGETTEATTGSEITTKKSSSGGSNGGGGGGGGGGGSTKGSSSSLSSSSTTTEAAKSGDTKTETTTTDAVSNATEDNYYAFDDIADKPWAVDAINTLSELGVINGVGGNKFAPDFNCKRADFVIMLVNVLGIDGTASDNFSDVEAGKYYYNYVGLAKEAGIVNGYGNNIFKPENLCTRAELMVMVANALKATGIDISADEAALSRFNDADEIPAWAAPYVAYLVSAGIVNGSNGKLNPNVDITRAEVAVIIYNVLDVVQPKEEAVEVVEEETEETTEAAEEVEETTEAAEEETVEATTEA